MACRLCAQVGTNDNTAKAHSPDCEKSRSTYVEKWTHYKVEMYERAKVKPYWTLQEIKDNCATFGSHWFSPDTMRFFASRVSDNVHTGPGGVFFVSSEQFRASGLYDGPRRYSVRQFKPENAHPDAQGSLIDEGPGCVFQQFKSSHGAHNKASSLAAGSARP